MKTPRLVGDYHQQCPTWGDLAREQDGRGDYLYLADVAVEIRTGLNHSDGQVGSDDADEDAAAANIYAAERFMSGDPERADWAADRAVESAFNRARDDIQLDPNDFEWSPNAESMPLAKETMHPAVQYELRRQMADLAVIRTHALTSEFVLRLREAIEVDPPSL